MIGFSPIRRSDPLFGQMTYMGDKLGYWEGKAWFTPADSQIEVFVEGTSNDDLASQHIFYEQLMQVWPDINRSIIAFLLVHLDEKHKVCLQSPLILNVTSLSVPSGAIANADWEVCFVLPHDEQHWTVSMTGHVPKEFSVDC